MPKLPLPSLSSIKAFYKIIVFDEFINEKL